VNSKDHLIDNSNVLFINNPLNSDNLPKSYYNIKVLCSLQRLFCMLLLSLQVQSSCFRVSPNSSCW